VAASDLPGALEDLSTAGLFAAEAVLDESAFGTSDDEHPASIIATIVNTTKSNRIGDSLFE
jgi:hypothetical protein